MKTRIKFDWILLSCVIILPLLGVFFIHSAQTKGPEDFSTYAITHFAWFIVGLIAMYIVAIIDLEQWYPKIKILYILSVIALASLYVLPEAFAPTINGAQRWLAIPGLFSIQVAEFTRIVFIILVAGIITEKTSNITKMDFGHVLSLLFEIAKWLFIPCVLIFFQPNTSGILIMGFGIFCMLTVSKIPLKYIYILLGAIAIIGITFVVGIFFFPEQMKVILGDYRVERLQGWLMPFQYTDYSYQLRTAITSYGSGGLSGLGHNNSMVTVSEAQTDFIMAVVGAEHGFIGITVVMSLFMTMLYRMTAIAKKTKDETKRYIVIGFMGIFAYQIFWNFAMIVGLVPISGIPMPFLSYGGSSMLSLFIMIGFIMSINSSQTFKNR